MKESKQWQNRSRRANPDQTRPPPCTALRAPKAHCPITKGGTSPNRSPGCGRPIGTF